MTKQVRVRAKGATHVTFAESDNELGVEYEIARKPDATLACACMAYVFNRDVPKTCKHLRAWQAFPTGSTAATDVIYTRSEKVRTERKTARGKVVTEAVETFTFHRRAISLDGSLR